MSTITLTRDRLYKRVWTEPVTKVAAAFGLSDQAVKKKCRKWNIPTPPRSYWARLEAGQLVEKKPLPKMKTTEHSPEQIDPEANALRRAELRRHAIPSSAPDGSTSLDLPMSLGIEKLHPAAQALHVAIKKGKPDALGIVRVNTKETPSVQVSQGTAERLVRALHAVYSELESRSVTLRPVVFYRETNLGFAKDRDEVAILIEEPIAVIKREPTPEEKRRPSSEWKLESSRPGGLLKFSLHQCEGYRSSSRFFQRIEGPNRPLEKLLHEVVEATWGFFAKKETERQRAKTAAEAREKAEADQRAAEAEQRKRAEAQRRLDAEREAAVEALRKEKARRDAHEKALEQIVAARAENMLRAAEWWRLHQVLLDYADECERRWKKAAGKGRRLTDQQHQWLAWARKEAEAMSPFFAGYPDVERDGAFDPTSIPLGGPYPQHTAVPLPPTMPAPGGAHKPPSQTPPPTTTSPSEQPDHTKPAANTAPPYTPPQIPGWVWNRIRRH